MTDPARPLERLSSVKNPLTPDRRARLVENDEYAAFARRVLRAHVQALQHHEPATNGIGATS